MLASGNIQPPPGVKGRGRPKGSKNKNKKKTDADLDLDFVNTLGNIQPPPVAKRLGRPKGSTNKDKMDVDLDLDFADASFSSSVSDVAFNSQFEGYPISSAPSASAAGNDSCYNAYHNF